MNNLPMQPLAPEEQQNLMNQLYILLGKQVKSYHKHRRMGENSSVSTELAQELLESIYYTLQIVGGVSANKNMEKALRAGQDLLEDSVQRAKSMLDLVRATAPQWQTECRWEALCCLERYLTSYDHLHLAHRGPDALFYPVLLPVPDDIRGIDYCMFYLNTMWLENQVIAGMDEAEQGQLWDRLPQDTLNQCEQLLINGIGKALIHTAFHGLAFTESEREQLRQMLRDKPYGELQRLLEDAAARLCRWLDLPAGNAGAYVQSAALQLLPRLTGALRGDCLTAVFL